MILYCKSFPWADPTRYYDGIQWTSTGKNGLTLSITSLICVPEPACYSQQLFPLRSHRFGITMSRPPSSIPASLCLDIQTLAAGCPAVYFLKIFPKEPSPQVYLSSMQPLDILNFCLCTLFSLSLPLPLLISLSPSLLPSLSVFV